MVGILRPCQGLAGLGEGGLRGLRGSNDAGFLCCLQVLLEQLRLP